MVHGKKAKVKQLQINKQTNKYKFLQYDYFINLSIFSAIVFYIKIVSVYFGVCAVLYIPCSL